MLPRVNCFQKHVFASHLAFFSFCSAGRSFLNLHDYEALVVFRELVLWNLKFRAGGCAAALSRNPGSQEALTSQSF